MTEAHGARTAADLVKRFVELVNQSLIGKSRFVKRVGDLNSFSENPESFVN